MPARRSRFDGSAKDLEEDAIGSGRLKFVLVDNEDGQEQLSVPLGE